MRFFFLSSPALIICCASSQEKIHKLYERKLHGDFDTNSHIQKKKEFRNPRYAPQLRTSLKSTSSAMQTCGEVKLT